MRHHNANRKFGRVRKQRHALLNSLARSVLIHQKIETTEPKAKEVRPFVEKLISTAKKETVASKRVLVAKVGPRAAKIAFDMAVKTYRDRKGGYTRIIKSKTRKSDGSKMAIIEFVK